MRESLVLRPGFDTFTLLDLKRRIANFKGITLVEGGQEAYSKPIATYPLDTAIMEFLRENQFSGMTGTTKTFTYFEDCRYKPAVRWAFGKQEEEEWRLELHLVANFSECQWHRGIALLPRVDGACGSAHSANSNFRMFQLLVQCDADVLRVAKELAADKHGIMVSWSDIGLGGIRRMSSLFREFYAGKNDHTVETLKNLARGTTIFQPSPLANRTENDVFVVETRHAEIFDAWERQRKEFANRVLS